jgi:predicted translin family RNA/ssDNA-binding protein
MLRLRSEEAIGMEEIARKELEALRRMVLTWKESYLKWVTPEGGDEFLAEELSEEIERHVYPYIRRLYQTDYLNQAEAREFLHCCHSQVEELRAALQK